MYLKRNNELEVLSLYRGDYSKRVYLREIARLLKLPLKNVQRAVNSLEKNKIMRSTIHGKNKYFSLNVDNIHSKLSVLQTEIYMTHLFLEKYPHCKAFVKGLIDVPVIVFGSFAKFIAEKDSDMDLLIICGTEEKLPLHVLPYRVHEIRLPRRTFIKALKKQETVIKEIEENHIILNNHSFYIDVLWSYYAQ